MIDIINNNAGVVACIVGIVTIIGVIVAYRAYSLNRPKLTVTDHEIREIRSISLCIVNKSSIPVTIIKAKLNGELAKIIEEASSARTVKIDSFGQNRLRVIGQIVSGKNTIILVTPAKNIKITLQN